MADYVQPGAVTRRVRFFDGQFLVDQDFIDDQKYHLDRERRLGKVLRITGIVDGLAVSTTGANTVAITAGTAIDADGRQIVLPEDRKLALPAAIFNDKQGIRLLVLYRELETELATTGIRSARRWLEDPQIIAIAPDGQNTEKAWNDTIPPLLLAQLRLDKGNVIVDSTVAQYAGLRVPGTVGLGTAATAAWRLSVNGRSRLGGTTDYGGDAVLSVAPGTVVFDAPGVVGGRLVVDGTTGNVGIGNANPGGYKLNVNGRVRVEGADYKTQTVLSVAPGAVQFDGPGSFGGRLSIDGTTGNVGIGTPTPGVNKLSVNGRSRLGGTTDYGTDAVLSVAPGAVQFDAPGVVGGRLTIDGGTGFVGIGLGANQPRTALDTGKGLISGATTDYVRAQFTMSGGGIVTWGGPNGRLKWTARFLVISMEAGSTFSTGHLSIEQPKSPIPLGDVYDGAARAADATGVQLNDWEALYAVHTVGGNNLAVSGYKIRRFTHGFSAPSNWILLAVVNSDDGTVKLGTGVVLSAKTSSSHSSPIPNGTIWLWSGAAVDIPGGWRLCDGGGGTPDLRSRFVVGAGDGNYAPGNAGEPDQHNHGFSIAGATVTTSTNGAHNHLPPSMWYDVDLLGDVAAAGKSWRSAIDRRSAPVQQSRGSTDGNHSHTVGLGAANLATATSTDNNRPRWYALCYIMKV